MALRVVWMIGNEDEHREKRKGKWAVVEGRMEALKANAVPVVSTFLRHEDEKVRELAVCALNVLALENDGKKEVLTHACANLAKLLKGGPQRETAYLHSTGVQLARGASELPAFRLAFAREILNDINLLGEVFGVAAIGAVHPLLAPEEPLKVRETAVTAVCYFLQSQNPPPGDRIRVPPVCPLSYIEQPAMYAIEQCDGILFRLLELVSQGGKAGQMAMACLEAMTEQEKPRTELREILSTENLNLPPQELADIQRMANRA